MKKLITILGIAALVCCVYTGPAVAVQEQYQGEGQLQGQGELQLQGQGQLQAQSQCSLSAGVGVGVGVAVAYADAASDGELANISVANSNSASVDVAYSNCIDDYAFSGVNGVNMVQQVSGLKNDVGQTITVNVRDVNVGPTLPQ